MHNREYIDYDYAISLFVPAIKTSPRISSVASMSFTAADVIIADGNIESV